jgi:hypothetical protein
MVQVPATGECNYVQQNVGLRRTARAAHLGDRRPAFVGYRGRLTVPITGGIIPPMILTLDAKRRLTVPANLAPARPGDHFIAEFDPEEDAIVFRRINKRADWLAVLKACPVKMDDLPPRSRELPKRRKL